MFTVISVRVVPGQTKNTRDISSIITWEAAGRGVEKQVFQESESDVGAAEEAGYGRSSAIYITILTPSLRIAKICNVISFV